MRRPVSLIAAVLFGPACAERVPLSEVPVVGGTPRQHAEARRTIVRETRLRRWQGSSPHAPE